MKILLLSDIPPCEGYTAGLVLSTIVRLLPRGSICGFIVANPTLDISVPEEFGNIPFELRLKPNENWSWLPQQRLLRKGTAAASWIGETIIENISVPRLIDQAVAFGRRENVDRVWAVLQGQTTIRMAKAVATRLGVPLHSHVWDPFSWWARANRLNGVTQHRIQSLFDETIAASAAVATASEPMAERFRRQFAVTALPVISSHPRAMAQSPETDHAAADPLIIGMAGQFYAADEWRELLRGLSAANWTITGRTVRLVVMGPQQPPGLADPHVTFLGWKEQHEAALILSQCDLLYCPYPFAATMDEVTRYSFPSKLVLYLAAGRPVVFHGPASSAPARYIQTTGCGVLVERPFATAIFNAVERVASEPTYYAELVRHAKEAFLADFTVEALERSVAAFFGGNTCFTVEDGDMRARHRADRIGARWVTEAQRRHSFASIVLSTGSRLRELKRRTKRLSVQLALKVPKLRSVHDEVLRLCGEVAALKDANVRLAGEAARLRAIVEGKTEHPVNASSVSSISEHTTDDIRRIITETYADQRVLILSCGQASDAEGVRYAPLVGSIGRTASPFAVVQLISSVTSGGGLPVDKTWVEVRSRLSRAAVQTLLRRALEDSVNRLIVDAREVDLVALAIEVANLLGIRATVVAAPEDAKIAWLSEQQKIDIIVKMRPAKTGTAEGAPPVV